MTLGSRRAMLLVALAVVGGTALAQRPIDDPDTEIAKRRFDKGRTLYEARDYERALAQFEEARAVKPLPAFDFNIARCLDRLERYEEAIAAYERFMNGTPDPFDAEEARARVKVLKARVAARAARAKPEQVATAPVPKPPLATEPKPTPPQRLDPEPISEPATEQRESPVADDPVTEAPRRDTPRRSFVVPLVVGAAGIAVTVIGTALVGSVVGPYNRLDTTCRPSCAAAEVDPLATRANAGYALIAIGGATLVADVVLWALAARSPRRPQALLLPTLQGVTLTGEF